MRRVPLALLGLLAACATSDAAAPGETTSITPAPTLGGVGHIPETVPPPRQAIERPAAERPAAEPEPLVVVTRPRVDETGEPVEAVGQEVSGNRVLMIGDSILAGTASRYGGAMCAALVPLGWQVEIDAEPGRSVEFGDEVLDARVDPLAGGDDDWDVAVVHLGSNYLGDRDAYEAELSGILERLAPRPTLLYTVTEYRPSWADVNEVIRGAAERFDHVSVVDWEEVARTPGVLSGDGLHPTTAGQEVLVELTASTLGSAPERDGDCLPTSFTDDSLIGRGDIPSTPNSASSGAYGTGTSGSDSSSSGGVVTQPPVTDPAPVTAAPPTTEAPPPATQPPPVTEAPPVTQPPPVTNPPATPPPTTLAP